MVVQFKHLVSGLDISECYISVDDLWIDASLLDLIVLFLQSGNISVEIPNLLLVSVGVLRIELDLLPQDNNLLHKLSD